MATYYPEDVEIEAYLSGTWTDISGYVVGDIVCDGYGILTDNDTDRTAGVGMLTLRLNNTTGTFNPLGNGTPLAGFTKGVFIRVRVTYEGVPKTAFYGRADRIQQTELPHGARIIEVTLVDWLDDASLFPLAGLTVQENKRIEQAVASILELMAVQPTGTSYSVGAYTFERVFDNVALNTRAISEFDKLALSEMSYIYLRGNGELVVESRNDRTGLSELSPIPLLRADSRFLISEDGRFIISEDGRFIVLEDSETPEFTALIDADPYYGDDMLNSMIVRAFTKTLDTTLVNLVDTPASWVLRLAAGVTRSFNIPYSDPNDRNTRINGYNMVAPVATTDYEAFANSDGTGTEYTSDITVEATYFSRYASYSITAPVNCYLMFLHARGNGVYTFVPDEKLVENSASIAQYGTRESVLDQKYQLSLIPGTAEAESIVDLQKDPHPKLKIVHFNANVSTRNMLAFLYYRVGDLVHISNPETGIDLYHWIQNIRWRITPGGVIDYWWGLKEHYSLKKGLSPLSIQFVVTDEGSEENDVVFSSSPFVDDISPITVSYWMWMSNTMRDTAISKTLRDVSSNPVAGYYIYTDGDGYVHFYATFSGGVGHWRTTSAPLSAAYDQWHLIAVSFNFSSASNNPQIFVDEDEYAVTEVSTPSGAYVSDAGIEMHVCQIPSAAVSYPLRFNGYIKDFRLFSKLITEANAAAMFANEDDYDYFTDDMIFQAFAVKTSQLINYVGQPIEENMKLRDNVYGLVGTAHYNHDVPGAEILGAAI